MKITQIVLAAASAYERKSQQIDLAALASRHEVEVVEDARLASPDSLVAHVYAPPVIAAASVEKLRVPFVSNAPVRARRFTWRPTPEPRRIVTPLRSGTGTATWLPEAVDDAWFDLRRAESGSAIGSFGRPSLTNAIEQAMARIDRFREDLTWNVFDHAPTPEQMSSLDVWVDPATEADDYDGFVAEAVAAGLPVVATRTPLNVQRLENGRIGFLVPLSDPNELTHAILAALFKPEVARPKSEAAGRSAGKFRMRHRLHALEELYQALIS